MCGFDIEESTTMVRVTIAEGIQARLVAGSDPLELCDAGGRVVGHFIPVVGPAEYRGVASPTAPAELTRRDREETGRSLGDILADLQDRR